MAENYPTICMFLSFFVSSCLLSYFPGKAKIVLAAVCVAAVVFSAVNPRKILRETLRRTAVMSLCAVVLSCAVSYCAFDVYAAGMDKLDGERDYVRFRINECYSSLPYEARYKATVMESSVIPKGTRVVLEAQSSNFERGSMVQGEVECLKLDGYLGSFDAKSYYNSKNIMLVCEAEELEYIGRDSRFSLTDAFAGINEKLTSMINAHTDGQAGGLLSAVLLGNRDGIYDSNKRDFRRLGISHLLVVSGTHFAVVVTMLETSLKKLKIKRKVRCAVNIAAVLFFMALTGMTPSVVRAGIMHILAQLSMIISRKPNTVNSFALSGSIIVLFTPLAAGDCGLQLSFAATYSCIVSRMFGAGVYRGLKLWLRGKIPHMKKLISAVMSLVQTVFMTSFVCVSLLPLIWLNFGEISLLSVPANILFIPLLSLLMYLGGAYLILYPLRLFIVPLATIINMFCSFISKAAQILGRLDGAVVSINYSFALYFLIPMTFLILILPYVSRKMKKRVSASVAAVFVMFISVVLSVRAYEKSKTYLVYSAEKKNDGFVLRSEGKLLLTEISDASYSFIYNLLDDMEPLHSTEIESVLVTHYHSKHLRLIGRLCEREIVRNIILTKPLNEKEESVFRSLVGIAKENGAGVSVYSVGAEIPFYGCKITCEREYLSRSTHPITSVKIETDEKTVYIASCSFNEMTSYDSIGTAESSDVLILGRHSPVYKKVFGLTFDTNPETVLVSDAAYDFADEGTREYFDSYAIIGGDGVEVKLN